MRSVTLFPALGSLLVRLCASCKQTYFVFSTACRVLHMCLYKNATQKRGHFNTYKATHNICLNIL